MWGSPAWWADGRSRASFAVGEGLAGEVSVGPGDEVGGYVWRPGEAPRPLTSALVESQPGGAGIPRAQRFVLDHDVELDAEVVAVAPVPLTEPVADPRTRLADGTPPHLLRLLCRYTSEEVTGAGFAEWPRGAAPVV